jgi:hypothetical protein
LFFGLANVCDRGEPELCAQHRGYIVIERLH